MKIDVTNLITVNTAAGIVLSRKNKSVTTAHIYNLIKGGKLNSVEIDGIKFLKRNEVEAINN